jgi:type I restriction enzyme R subunit
MSTHAYTESQLVEQPAIGLFAALGWQMVSARSETLGSGGTLGRETKGEVVLVDRLRAALGKLNPALPSEAIQSAIDELTRDRSATSLEAANREIYRLLKDGIPVSVLDPEHGGQKTERLRVIDWEQPEQNDFLLVSDAANRLAPLPVRSSSAVAMIWSPKTWPQPVRLWLEVSRIDPRS